MKFCLDEDNEEIKELSLKLNKARALGYLESGISEALNARLRVHCASESLPEKQKRQLLSVMHKMRLLEQQLDEIRSNILSELNEIALMD